MKATIRFYDQFGSGRQVTVETDKNEPNAIIRKAVEMNKIKKHEAV